jgi:hypothetical protein
MGQSRYLSRAEASSYLLTHHACGIRRGISQNWPLMTEVRLFHKANHAFLYDPADLMFTQRGSLGPLSTPIWNTGCSSPRARRHDMRTSGTQSPRIDGNRAQAGRKHIDQRTQNNTYSASSQVRERHCGCHIRGFGSRCSEQIVEIRSIATAIANPASSFTLKDLGLLALEFEKARAMVADEGRRWLALGKPRLRSRRIISKSVCDGAKRLHTDCRIAIPTLGLVAHVITKPAHIHEAKGSSSAGCFGGWKEADRYAQERAAKSGNVCLSSDTEDSRNERSS